MLKNVILFALLLLATDSYSAETFSVAYFGSMIEGTDSLHARYQNKNVVLTISDCIVSWDNNEPFYVVSLDSDHFAIKKTTYDFLSNQFRHNGDKITNELIKMDGICSITF